MSAGVVDLKTDRRRNESHASDGRIRPHIAYLDFLKKHRLLELAIEGQLPAHVERAAKMAVAAELIKKHGRDKIRVIQDGAGNIAISVDVAAKDLEAAEVNDYIRHYKLQKLTAALVRAEAFRVIEKGQRYEVRSGTYMNRAVLVRGLDREIFGVDWHLNFQHPLCESHVYRVQKDGLPMRGRVYVCMLLDEKRDVLLHEKEIGLHII